MGRIDPKGNREFEKAEPDVWIEGVIVDVQDRVNENKKYKDEETGEWKTRVVDETRFVFELEGYKFKHYSRWMTKSVNKKANLYDKYLKKLCPELPPDTAVDTDKLKGMKVKTMWENEEGADGNSYQHISQIRALENRDIQVKDELEDKSLPF